ncbi:MAG: bifunctional nuclease family protein [candidate division WOR-3 bacterium]|nr:bifunctional nuclease family protein [candidate division WOR-3 bacterium]MDW8151118.1 bifunctional nuclease family protein [candidate division WOR-3 bacterium]
MKNLIEVEVKNVIVVKDEHNESSFLVILAEKEGNKVLPISVGLFEAQAIARAKEGIKTERPLTHDLIVNIFKELELKVEKIVINDLINDVFYARIIVRKDDKILSIDARPSDSIAIAILANVPIFVSSSVMERAGEESPPPESDEDLEA